MKLRGFLNIVPNAVQLWAAILGVSAVLIALVMGYKTADQGAVLRTICVFGGAGLLTGTVVAIWLLCLGFVFADARRRDMRSVLWVLVAAFFPHLLGFLLYFVMRHPIVATCNQCGKRLAQQQPFCSWCGGAQFSSNSAQEPLTAPQAASR